MRIGKPISIFWIALVAVVALASCAQPKYASLPSAGSASEQKSEVGFSSGQKLYWQWERAPSGNAEGVMRFRVFAPSSLDGFPEPVVLGAAPAVKLWMPGMGHGSSPVVVEPLLDASGAPAPGAYRVRAMHFIMPGEWVVRISLTEGASVVTAEIPYYHPGN